MATKHPPAPALLDKTTVSASRHVSHAVTSNRTPYVKQRERVEQSPESRARRKHRFRLVERMRHFTTRERQKVCLCTPIPTAQPEIRGNSKTKSSHFSKLMRCGYATTCPNCSVKVLNRHAVDIHSAVQQALEKGYGIGFLTFTTRHALSDSAKSLITLLKGAFKAVLSGRGWQNDRADFGILGMIKSWDCTFSWVNGWHIHLHVLVFFDQHLPRAKEQRRLDQVMDRMWNRFYAYHEKEGDRLPEVYNQRAVVVDRAGGLGKYMAKLSGISQEMARSDFKKGKRHDGAMTFTHWEILQLACELDGEDAEPYKALWRDWEEAIYRTQVVSWSKGFKQHFGIANLSDEEIAAEEEAYDWVHVLTNEEWALIKGSADRKSMALSYAATDGVEGLRGYLHHLRKKKVKSTSDAL